MPYNRPIPEQKQRGLFGFSLDAVVQAEKMIQIALMLPCAAFIGWLLGAWADGKLHTHWIGLVGIMFGGVSGLVGAVRMALAANRKLPADETEQDAEKDPGAGGRNEQKRRPGDG